jgi:8-oxo-dGTP pyrophosphatase MutT (NUDIX family)/predicted DNA-binding WGR domain protein
MLTTNKQSKHLLIALGLVLNKDQVLLTRRIEENQPNLNRKWEVPGGKVKLGEAPEAAAVRELKEETGYTVQSKYILPFTYTTCRIYGDSLLYATILCVHCELENPDAKLTKPDKKIAEILWKKVDEIPYVAMLPGSREFIWHVAKRESLPLPKTYTGNYSFIEFRKINAKSNSRKRYQLTYRISPDEENPYTVTRMWGRIGGDQRIISESFAKHDDACNYLLIHCKARIAHGYSISQIDEENFPDLDWLNSHRNLIHNELNLQLSLFNK